MHSLLKQHGPVCPRICWPSLAFADRATQRALIAA